MAAENKHELLIEFGTQLRELREASGLSQSDLEGPPVAGFSIKTISAKERGVGSRAPEWDFVKRYVKRCRDRRDPRQKVPVEKYDETTWARTWELLEDALAEQTRAWRDSDSPAAGSARPGRRLGLPVGDCDPLLLEVHPAIQLPGTDPAAVLPAYVPRAHDARLREIVDGMLDDGRSRLVTLVGGSSTGKTRAGWELLQYLERAQPGRWWLWHPYNPTHPQAVLADLERVGRHTIVWLNEAQHYLMPNNQRLAERVAAGLRNLLHTPDRGPVLILATIWPQYWDTLTSPPSSGGPEPYEQARKLLTGTRVSVADTFTPAELAALDVPGVDPRLGYAAGRAEGGRITQYLAGAPELEDRYRAAVPAARAVIQAAMDARRLGHPLAIPHALLAQAADGYLDDHDWDALDKSWLEQALSYASKPCKGARGPLTRIRSRPTAPTVGSGQPYVRLADYLEQLGRVERTDSYPPPSLWEAFAATVTDPDLLRHLGHEARWRGRYQRAISLYSLAADRGDADAWWLLASMREDAGDPAGAENLARLAATRGVTAPLHRLASRRRVAGDVASARALTKQAAGLGNLDALVDLGQLAEKEHDHNSAARLYRQAADGGNHRALGNLALLRDRDGHHAEAVALAIQAADGGNPWALQDLALSRDYDGHHAEAVALAIQAVERGAGSALRHVGLAREDEEDYAGAEEAYRLANDHGEVHGLFCLAVLLEEVYQDTAGGEEAFRQAADRGSVDALTVLAERADQAGDTATADALIARAVELGYLDVFRELASAREEDNPDRAENLLRQAAHMGCKYSWFDLALKDAAGDLAGTEAVCLKAADRGALNALEKLALLWERAGAHADAEKLRRFGLVETRSTETSGPHSTWIAAPLDFASYGGPVAE
ncbi:hypothetical protein [Streptomyces sp. NPDC052015]|uniref:hypothetical protein n=1 Tax=Streptomyces sp. NPDC052015 TaxID=3154755 RepID=UPI0034475189